MRSALLALFTILPFIATQARPSSVEIHCARPFGFFVGDLVRATIDIRTESDAIMQKASLPHPGPLTVSLDLRDIAVEETTDGGQKLWRLHLTYQNFYVALDARELEIPGFSLSFSRASGAETAEVPSWRIGVSPLREVMPEKKEKPEGYPRPDSLPAYAEEAAPRAIALALGAAALLGLIAIARDRAWPPFHKSRVRIFSALARRIGAASRRPCSEEILRQTLQTLHRGIDAAGGRSILAADLPAFLLLHPQFRPLESSFARFFAASHLAFFDKGESSESFEFGMTELAEFAKRLAERERAA